MRDLNADSVKLEITSIATLSELASGEALLLVSPALAGGVVMYFLVRRFPSPATLPLLMVTFVACFFAVFCFTGTTLEVRRSEKASSAHDLDEFQPKSSCSG